MAWLRHPLYASLAAASWTSATLTSRQAVANDNDISACPGYKASNVYTSQNSFTATLTLAGAPCDVYGVDIEDLVLSVQYETSTRLHVKIQDAASRVYQVPEEVLPLPVADSDATGAHAIDLHYVANPFSFSITRQSTGEVLFDTSAASIVFESQYLRLRTKLPESPSLYGLDNLYGAMMSAASYKALLNRRPAVSPLVMTRPTFAGSGRKVGKWFGDNYSDSAHYLISIAELLEFAALYQMPMVGSDVCGFGGATNELLCARWAALGAFSPFYRNHNQLGSPPQEFYLWPLVADAARGAIATRYQLLDYIYTAMYAQNQTGTPLVQPMFFAYPGDPNRNSLQYQYFFGPGILVAPVTTENSTTADVYLPDDIFYDFYTHEAVRGTGSMVHLPDVPYTTIPLYYKGGSIVALRAQSTNTTTELRKRNFAIVIAPGLDGTASGDLYLDDGDSLVQPATSYVRFSYATNGRFSMAGAMDYDAGVMIESVTVLGPNGSSSSTSIPLTGPYYGWI